MVIRVIRAIFLDASLYRMVADNEEYMQEGAIIATAVSVLAGLGAAIGSGNFFWAFIAETLSGVVFGWLLWSMVTTLVGTALGGSSSFQEVVRTLAYANAPRFLALLGFFPCWGWIFRLAAWILTIVAGLIAIREAMEFETDKALITALIGFMIYIIVSFIINITLGVAAGGLRFIFGG